MNAASIITAATITKVWIALGGPEPKRGRARGFYRDGKNQQSVSLNDAKGCWFDHRDGVGGGVLNLIQRVLGCDQTVALRWLSDFTGVPLDDRLTSLQERRELAQRRERDHREMRDAGFFRIAAMKMAEHILDQLPEAVPERYSPTQLLIQLRAEGGVGLLATYRELRARDPRLTAALVHAGEQAWNRLCTRLACFIAANAEVPHVG